MFDFTVQFLVIARPTSRLCFFDSPYKIKHPNNDEEYSGENKKQWKDEHRIFYKQKLLFKPRKFRLPYLPVFMIREVMERALVLLPFVSESTVFLLRFVGWCSWFSHNVILVFYIWGVRLLFAL